MHRLPHALGHVEVVVLSLLAAFLYALAWVLQHRAAGEVPREAAMKPALLVRLAANPVWLCANLLDGVAYVARFLALRRGSLLVVEPLIVTALLFALPLGVAFGAPRLNGREWVAATALVGGLALFLAASNPDVGRGTASTGGWLAVGLVCGGASALLVWLGHRGGDGRRALLLGAASGILFGIVAALTKASARLLTHGVVHTLTSWEPYALVVIGAGGLLVSQTAFQAGPLKASLPALTLAEPVVAAVIGVLAFHEHVVRTPAALAVQAVAAAATATGSSCSAVRRLSSTPAAEPACPRPARDAATVRAVATRDSLHYPR
jgi:drug/metabolite transporter (DMT)-like permease